MIGFESMWSGCVFYLKDKKRPNKYKRFTYRYVPYIIIGNIKYYIHLQWEKK